MNSAYVEGALRPYAVAPEGRAAETFSVSHAVQRTLQAWAMEELAGWRLNSVTRGAAAAGFARLHASSKTIYVYEVSGGSVTLPEKPSGFEEIANNKKRALAYLAFFRAVCRFLPDAPPFQLALGTGDKLGERVDLPVFAFQKRRGERSILLPDIDFLNHEFYTAPRYADAQDYRSKRAKAIFVGSTSGGRVTPEAARHCTLPRLRAARFFEGSARVEFFLPQIVQTTNAEAAEILRQMPFCQTGYMPWPEQLQRRFLLSMDGNGATCSRVVIALKSNSVLIKYHSDDLLYYFRHLQPWLHYVPVEKDADVDRVLDMEQAQPEFFESIAENGRQFATSYLSPDAVFAYTVELFKLYAACFSPAGAAQAVATPPPPLRQATPPVQKLPSRVVFVAHIQGRGDVPANSDGWIGDAKDGRGIEGFTFSFGSMQVNRLLSYRALAQDGTARQQVAAGAYCGTRGQATPIHGVVIDVAGTAANVPKLVYEGVFRDGFASGPLRPGAVCRSPRGAPMVAMRIALATADKET